MENRKDRRFLERNNTRIKDAGQATKTSAKRGINAHTHDISVTGARISSSQDFLVGYVIRIVIDLGGADPALEVDGEVVWTRKSEDGTGFDIGAHQTFLRQGRRHPFVGLLSPGLVLGLLLPRRSVAP
jgi:hypothetical protein